MQTRDQKKRATFAAILVVAEESFTGIGYDATSIEAIAQSCGISPGTIYNYFGTKSAMLAAVVTSQMEDVMDEAGDRLDLGATNPVDALMPILELYVGAMTAYGYELLKELFRAGFDPAQTEMLTELVSSDERVLAHLVDSLRAMKSEGMLSSAVDIDGAALLVYSIIAVALMMYASFPGMPPEEVTALCRRQLEIAADGLAP
jgi:AcrR family transcriptional regulator